MSGKRVGRVLTIGSTNTDIVTRVKTAPAPGETVVGESYDFYAGGKGANQAVAAARAGATVAFVGAIGDDEFGEARMAELEHEGIDVARIQWLKGERSGMALIVVDENGENEIVFVPGANGLLDPEYAISALRDVPCDAISLTCETPWDVLVATLENRPDGVTAVVNAAPFDARIADVLSLIDVLIVNEIESEQLTGVRDPASPDQWLDALQTLGVESVVITLGAEGAIAAHGDVRFNVPSVEVAVVDTTGAGDTFCGAFTAWFAGGALFEDAVRAGVAAGACAVGTAGAQPSIPDSAAIDAMLQRMA